MNFPLVLFGLFMITGAIWLLDYFVLRHLRSPEESEPWWIEHPKSFFPVILIVFTLRSFVMEPFKIPSGSMIPTLLVGDFILVNKFTYGIRLPVINHKIIEMNQPKRGDVMVFRYPQDPSIDYIKRIVGLPGDTVAYKDKQLIINGKRIKSTFMADYKYVEKELSYVYAQQFEEALGEHNHKILINPEIRGIHIANIFHFPFRDNCTYTRTDFTCIVPKDHYFTLGDNRDSSSDSRYWGFVPDENIVGKAFIIWWNFNDFGRIGLSI